MFNIIMGYWIVLVARVYAQSISRCILSLIMSQITMRGLVEAWHEWQLYRFQLRTDFAPALDVRQVEGYGGNKLGMVDAGFIANDPVHS